MKNIDIDFSWILRSIQGTTPYEYLRFVVLGDHGKTLLMMALSPLLRDVDLEDFFEGFKIPISSLDRILEHKRKILLSSNSLEDFIEKLETQSFEIYSKYRNSHISINFSNFLDAKDIVKKTIKYIFPKVKEKELTGDLLEDVKAVKKYYSKGYKEIERKIIEEVTNKIILDLKNFFRAISQGSSRVEIYNVSLEWGKGGIPMTFTIIPYEYVNKKWEEYKDDILRTLKFSKNLIISFPPLLLYPASVEELKTIVKIMDLNIEVDLKSIKRRDTQEKVVVVRNLVKILKKSKKKYVMIMIPRYDEKYYDSLSLPAKIYREGTMDFLESLIENFRNASLKEFVIKNFGREFWIEEIGKKAERLCRINFVEGVTRYIEEFIIYKFLEYSGIKYENAVIVRVSSFSKERKNLFVYSIIKYLAKNKTAWFNGLARALRDYALRIM